MSNEAFDASMARIDQMLDEGRFPQESEPRPPGQTETVSFEFTVMDKKETISKKRAFEKSERSRKAATHESRLWQMTSAIQNL